MSGPPLKASTADPVKTERPKPKPIRPFSAVAIGVKAGFAGAGLEIATPLAKRFNLRASGSAFQYEGDFDASGLQIHGNINFRSVTANLDWYPFNNGFRISPGVTIYNGNGVSATTSVPGGQSFDLGDGTYSSSVSDPVHGTATMTFGRRTAPNLTVGFGNLIPRSGRHFSVPFEIGVQYIGDPAIVFNLQGTVCNSQGCSQIQTDPTAQADLKQEQTDINNTVSLLRFYPIISIGFGYRF
jgi:hypothetical protein